MNSFIAGAVAGLSVDIGLYPIDTIKTRIQSKNGFLASGGFTNMYKGLSAVAIGSVPGGAVFFLTYDTVKSALFEWRNVPLSTAADGASSVSSEVVGLQAMAAMTAETAACCIRVPVEMVKQKMQAGHYTTLRQTFSAITLDRAKPSRSLVGRLSFGFRSLFTGMPIMLLRELPFSAVQMMLYEYAKFTVSHSDSLSASSAYLFPLCGAVSGGFSAFITTPLDVVKTRIMLQEKGNHAGGFIAIGTVVSSILQEPAREGDRFGAAQKFFRGAGTRVLWISLGGGIFFGSYETVKRLLSTTN